MLLAAGEGRRLRPLTLTTPKPLVQVGGTSLIRRHIAQLVAAGVTELVVNLHHLGEEIRSQLGNGEALGVSIQYSEEPELLETGGGIQAALPLLADDEFLVVAADVFADVDYDALMKPLATNALARLLLVDNPDHHPTGDFWMSATCAVEVEQSVGARRLTYAGICLMHRALIERGPPGAFPLRDLLFPAVAAGEIDALYHDGIWSDVGTPERLAALQQQYGD